MLLNCILYLIGLSSIALLDSGKQAQWVAIITALVLMLYGVLHRQRFNDSHSYVKIKRYARRFVWLTIGVLWGSIAVVVWWHTAPSYVANPQVAHIDGFICSLPSIPKSSLERNSRATFNFCMSDIDGKKLPFYVANKIKLSLYRGTSDQLKNLTAGSFWQFDAKLRPIHGRRNPGGFDYEKWLVSEGYIATGYVKKVVSRENKSSLKSIYHGFRQKVFDRLKANIPDSPTKGMLIALAIGDRQLITSDQWQVIKGSGTSHLLAISGLHIGIAALWSYYFCLLLVSRIRWITDRIPAQTVAQIASLLGAISVALLSGLGYPAQRALIMLIVFLVTKWSSRQLSLANVYAISLAIITTIQPFSVLTVSFWLSALAVGIIVLLLSYQAKMNGKYPKLKGWLRINWFLFVALMPITWAVFDSISTVGFIANLILIPLTSVVTTPLVYLGLLSLMISDQLATGIFYLTDMAIGLTFSIQSFVAHINQWGTVSSLPISTLILALLLTLIILLPAKIPFKSLTIPLSFIILFSLVFNHSERRFKMVVFDIGQGLAIYLSVDGKNMLFDTGYGNPSFSMAKSEILPYFSRQGIDHLDLMVISHGDNDHAGGVRDIVNAVRVDAVYSGEPIDINSLSCHIQPDWKWGNVGFKFLDHSKGLVRKGNDSSCVLQITLLAQAAASANGFSATNRRILLTGDIEKPAEHRLVELGLDPVEILLAPHHGSLTSSTTEFLNATRPKTVIFSAGYDNQWKFPKKTVVERYDSIGTKSLTTYQQGAISVTLKRDGTLMVKTERNLKRHFWQF